MVRRLSRRGFASNPDFLEFRAGGGDINSREKFLVDYLGHCLDNGPESGVQLSFKGEAGNGFAFWFNLPSVRIEGRLDGWVMVDGGVPVATAVVREIL